MNRAIVLQHADFEGPARIGDLLAARGYAIEVRHLHRGDRVPSRMEARDLLVVMGGSMGVGDAHRPDLAFLGDEIRLLEQCIATDAPVLGVCLGAQLLAHAAGARVYPMAERGGGAPAYEVGWGPIWFHAKGNEDLLRGVPPEATVLHWHGDTFELPSGATLLASSAACANQAFRLGRRQFAFQFHCEVERDHVESFLRDDADFVTSANGSEGAARLLAETAVHVAAMRSTADAMLENVFAAMSART
jgi:GMP synthase (glutamine-hydrolysing)